MVPKLKYLNYISCGLAHDMVACFNNLCLKNLTTYGYSFQYGCTLTVTIMTSQITRFPALNKYATFAPNIACVSRVMNIFTN